MAVGRTGSSVWDEKTGASSDQVPDCSPTAAEQSPEPSSLHCRWPLEEAGRQAQGALARSLPAEQGALLPGTPAQPGPGTRTIHAVSHHRGELLLGPAVGSQL